MKSRLKDLLARLMHKKWIKLISLVVAFGAWCAIKDVISHETMVSDVRVKVMLDADMNIMNQNPRNVSLLVRGSQQDVRALTANDAQVLIDLRDQDVVGSMDIPIDASHVQLPGSLRAVYTRPNTVQLTLDRVIEKTVPVKVDIRGELGPGYVLDGIQCKPVSVVVRGPEFFLRKLDQVRTMPLNLAGHSRPFETPIEVLPPPGADSAVLEPPRVTVTIDISERAEFRDFADVPVAAVVPPGVTTKATISPSSVFLQVKGAAEYLDVLDKGSLIPFVSCTDLEPGVEYELPIRVNTPAGTTISGLEPQTVQVIME